MFNIVLGAGRCTEPGSRYLLAQCCLALGKYAEAEEALVGPMQPLAIPSSAPTAIPGGAAGLYLLGRICRCCHTVSTHPPGPIRGLHSPSFRMAVWDSCNWST